MIQWHVIDGQDVSVLTGKSHLKDFEPLQCLCLFVCLFVFVLFCFVFFCFFLSSRCNDWSTNMLNILLNGIIKGEPCGEVLKAWQRYPVIDSRPILCYFPYDFSYGIGSRNSHCRANESGNSCFSLHLKTTWPPPGMEAFYDLVILG